MLPLLNPLPLLVTFAAMFGVLFHDTQFDHAASLSLAAPVSISTFGSIESAMRLNDHTHVERSSFSSSQPAAQTRLDDKKYVLSKKLASNTTGSDYHWPSV